MSSKTRYHSRIAGVCAVVALARTAAADVRHVPSQYPTIQAAINAAQNGDSVVVADGYYTGAGNRDISFGGKAITVRSANGPANCTVDSQALPGQPRLGFRFDTNEGPASVLDGFTIRGGYQFNGAGVTVSNASPTIRNCVMTANTCDCWGAGLYVEGPGTALIENCKMVGNTSNAEGGGVFIWNSSPTIRNCEISGNAGDFGAGVCAFSGVFNLVNCVIADNGPAYGAGGVYMSHGTMTNCTVVGNTSTNYAAAVYLQGTATIRNSVLWGNTGPTELIAPAGTITFSNVEGGFAGAGNISVDPKFSESGFELDAGSPCIDAANSAAPGLPTMDLNGNARRVDDPATSDTGIGGSPMADMGAFEFQACACDVDGGGLAVTDIFSYLSMWFAGDLAADFDGNQQVQVPDIFSFLGCWFGGCSN